MNNLGLMDLYERSNNNIAIDLGRRFRDYRIALRLTQKEIAEQSGVSVMTIVRFENGEAHSIRLDNFIALLRAIERLEGISEAIPEMPMSLYHISKKSTSSRKRVRKKKTEK